MLIGRDGRHRFVVTASLLLGLLGVLLGCAGGTAAAAPPGPAAAPDAATVVAAAAGPVQSPGCGRSTAADDSGAHPGTPPRGASAYELLPALHQTGGPASPAAPGQAFLVSSPLPVLPPPAPPSPVELSVLRV
ncbi:hypothetical protein AB0903_20520 [Streptomyces sp. NPDC048389]|uniref:hypothetical protein n=1 Tax=Streptomyces sp. NPDC048389 TaxID=3154622 RepID=UPI003452EC2E